MSPEAYQLYHPWHWLTYGQNAAALNTAAACLGTIAVIAAGFFAYRTYRTTADQLNIARQEISLLKRQHLESSRPHLSMNVPPQKNSARDAVLVVIKNTGLGRALDITGTNIAIICTTLPPGGEVHASFSLGRESDGPGDGKGSLQYSSVDGRRFRTEFMVANWSTVVGERVEEIVK